MTNRGIDAYSSKRVTDINTFEVTKMQYFSQPLIMYFNKICITIINSVYQSFSTSNRIYLDYIDISKLLLAFTVYQSFWTPLGLNSVTDEAGVGEIRRGKTVCKMVFSFGWVF